MFFLRCKTKLYFFSTIKFIIIKLTKEKSDLYLTCNFFGKNIQRFLRSLSGSGRLRHQTAGSGTDRHVPEPAQPAQAQAPTGLDRPWLAQPAHAGTYRLRPAATGTIPAPTGPDSKIQFLYQL